MNFSFDKAAKFSMPISRAITSSLCCSGFTGHSTAKHAYQCEPFRLTVSDWIAAPSGIGRLSRNLTAPILEI
jgi:hypothetical protein